MNNNDGTWPDWDQEDFFNFEPDGDFEEELTRKAFENTYKILIGATTING